MGSKKRRVFCAGFSRKGSALKEAIARTHMIVTCSNSSDSKWNYVQIIKKAVIADLKMAALLHMVEANSEANDKIN